MNPRTSVMMTASATAVIGLFVGWNIKPSSPAAPPDIGERQTIQRIDKAFSQKLFSYLAWGKPLPENMSVIVPGGLPKDTIDLLNSELSVSIKSDYTDGDFIRAKDRKPSCKISQTATQITLTVEPGSSDNWSNLWTKFQITTAKYKNYNAETINPWDVELQRTYLRLREGVRQPSETSANFDVRAKTIQSRLKKLDTREP